MGDTKPTNFSVRALEVLELRGSSYEERQEARKERYEAAAEKALNKGNSLLSNARDMQSVIPFGQPILVGHHSERRDRRYRDRIHATMGKGFEELGKADHYASKAASVGTGGISSDDPEAITKLAEQLADLEKSQEVMKKINAIIRRFSGYETRLAECLKVDGVTEEMAVKALSPCPYSNGRIGFASYSLSNNNANMARIRKRIEDLKKTLEAEDVEKDYEGFSYREDVADNRIHFLFAGKPDEATRTVLKRNAFKWSPSRGAWVRQLNGNGKWAALQVIKELTKKPE